MPENYRAPGVYIQENGTLSKPIPGASTSTTVLIGSFPKGPQYTATKVPSLREFGRIFGNPRNNHLSSQVIKQFFENGGDDVWIISTGVRFSGTAAPLVKGLSPVSQIPPFNILLIPDTTMLSDREAAKVFQAVLPLIEQRRTMYILDPPQQDAHRQTVKDLAAWFRNLPDIQHPNVILYHPRVHVHSQLPSTPTVAIPASGTMAGLFARIDRTRGVWKSPAGIEATLQGVVGLDQVLTSKDIDLLTSANINSLKQISPSTYVAWGARTLSSDPEWKYVPVRRMALFLESSIQQGIAWAVFEPNDEPLWAQIRLSISNFLESLYRQGAFQGTKAEHAYFVRCGRDTTTASDQAAGVVTIMVGFAPLKPAEFTILRIPQKTRQVS